MSGLHEHYRSVIVPELFKELSCANIHQVPKITKVVLNMGIGEGVVDRKSVEVAQAELSIIAGQKAVITKAKKAIAGFKIRKGMAIGCKVTLRRQRMYDFLDRLINIALPRVRDFRGLPTKSFDGRGSYAIGLKEQIMFPEIDYDKIDAIRGMDIVIVTSATNDSAAKLLLEKFNVPFRDKTPTQS